MTVTRATKELRRSAELKEHRRRAADINEVAAENVRLVIENRMLHLKAGMDPLTKLGNRARLDAVLHTIDKKLSLSLPQRRDSDNATGHLPLDTVAIVIDLNKFKELNDTKGHKEGDRMLIAAANAIRSSLRSNDEAFRMGGDEFVVIANNANDEVAQILKARITQNFTRAGISGSAGHATLKEVDSAEGMLDLADKRMYASKNGRKSKQVLVESVRT
ncbi:MAG: GGDEF domain-containing protein [Candidatus Micrarchaeota archaeon]|nr:GGDEF domain-containing protein [Candidatus Micrarchaeota archaeon]MDE1833919.1 GGDEF domain-containing protein [Candidatus Micrarchaeota archaeon]MDE1859805.1 GGDEF domain-containing protein [Candidatus Micrarchaeota archaeon]